MRNRIFSFALAAGAVFGLQAGAQSYKVTNIVSDGSVPATTMDANFINPWAISSSGTWWISTQGSGMNYVVPAAGTIAFRVVVPAASGLTTATGLPAGSVTTGGATGMLLPNGTKASFLFSTLDGTISGWNSKLGTAGAISQVAINNNAAGASYPGLAILNTSTSSYVLAPNFGTGNAIEVYDNTFKLTHLAGSFTDPNLPAGYAPFSVHVLGTQVFVNYALRSAAAPYRTVDAIGNGVVDVFDTTGTFVSRVVTGGNLNSPWGIAFAPASFGIFSGDLLVGNFGDGKINVYDPRTFQYLGQMMDGTGKSLVYASLWELLTGGTAVTGTTAVSGGDTSTVYFTAGLTGEVHGLFAGITNTTVAGATPAFGFTASGGAATAVAGSSTGLVVSVAPANGFSGTVSLACSGLPVGASCVFAPAQLVVSPTSVTTGTVTVMTSKATAGLPMLHDGKVYAAGVSLAMLLPLGWMLVLRRRSASGVRLLGVVVLFVGAVGMMAGCSDVPSAQVVTPAGTSTVTITATSGAVVQTATVALTVK